MSINSCKKVYSFIEYWKEILRIYEKADKSKAVIFRGQSNEKFGLLASVFRKNKDGSYPDESELYHNALVDEPEEFKKGEHLSNLVKMQHYGSATRLLDFSYNSLIALYMAVEQDPDKDGKVFVVSIEKSKILHHTSDKALMLACLPPFDKNAQNEIKSFCSAHRGVIHNKDIENNATMRRFLHEIRSEFPAFETEIIGEDLLKGYFVRAYKNNERMKAQDGLFYICGLGNEQSGVEKLVAKCIIISAQAKKQILQELKYMGISQDTIYLGLERRLLKSRHKRIDFVETEE